MYDLTPIGNNLFTCDKCGVVVKSGLMNIYRHSLVCGKVKTWPIDPNAPKNTPQDWINKGYKLVIIGADYVGAQSVQRVDRLMAALEEHKGAVMVVGNTGDFTDDEITKLKASRTGPSIQIKPLPDMFDAELKALSEQIYIKEDNRNWSGRVTPREQKNRERFNKKGRK